MMWGRSYPRVVMLAIGVVTVSAFAPVATRAAAAAATPVCAETFPGPKTQGKFARLTPDGRYLVYQAAPSGFPGDSNGYDDIMWIDRTTNTAQLVSVTPENVTGQWESSLPSISDDGRYVAFKSGSDTLVAGDNNGMSDIFVRDMVAKTTELISVTTDEGPANSGAASGDIPADRPAISADGRYVAFVSSSPTLVAENTGDKRVPQIFVRDRQEKTTTRETLPSVNDTSPWGGNVEPSLSANGRYLAFTSRGSEYGGEPNQPSEGHVVLRDRHTATDTLISGPRAPKGGRFPQVTADGNEVIYLQRGSDMSNPSDTDVELRVFNRTTKLNTLLSPTVAPRAQPGPAISPDGRFVAYVSRQPVGSNSDRDFVVVLDRADGSVFVGSNGPAYPGLWLSITGSGGELALTGKNGDGATAVNGVAVVPTRLPFLGAPITTSLKQNQSHVTVLGYGSNIGGSTLSFGEGVTVHSVTQTSVGAWTADVSTAKAAPLGARPITATSGGCTSTAHDTLNVTPAVTISSLTPNVIAPGATRNFSLAGDGFTAGATVTGTGLTITNVAVADAGHATFTATADGATSARTITFTNSDGTSAQCANCLSVDPVMPTVDYIGPSDKALSEIVVVLNGDDVDEIGTEVSVQRNSSGVSFTRSSPEPGVVLLKLSAPSDGNYDVRVRPRDDAGNLGPEVLQVVQRGEIIARLNAYGPFQGGAETTAGDVDGDGIDELITASGPGGGPHVRVFSVDAPTGASQEVAGWFAYGETFTGGVRVAAADIDGDGTDEVITAPGPGGGPHVRAFHINPNGTSSVVASFFAYHQSFTNGVFVSGGNVSGDPGSRDEIVVGPGAGGGPHVRAFGDSGDGVIREHFGFMAYNPKFAGGVRVAAADLDGDGRAELVTAAGPGGGPHVQAFDVNGGTKPPVLSSFYAYDEQFRGGVFLASADVEGDGLEELVVGAGRGGGPHIRVLAVDGPSTDDLTELAGFYAYDATFGGGVSAAGGDIDGDGDDDVVTTPGAGMEVRTVVRRIS